LKRVVYRGRRAVEIENDIIRVTVLNEGGHVAEILDKRTGVNPLWTPHWESVEPSEFFDKSRPEFGAGAEAQLVAGLMGHNICLDLFGGPTETEKTAGVPVHGEGPVALYTIEADSEDRADPSVVMTTVLERAQIRFIRRLRLLPNGVLSFTEELENLAHVDRPIGWTQHVTLGAPFLEPGRTRFAMNTRLAKVIDQNFNDGLGMQVPDAVFEWPRCPQKDGSLEDLSFATTAVQSAGFTAHLMEGERAWFVAWTPRFELAFGYVWQKADFPWLSRWEENHMRPWAPWDGKGYALGMEFGVSPFVENRRAMVERGKLFGVPTFRWLGARQTLKVEFVAFLQAVVHLPTSLNWDGESIKINVVPEDSYD